MRYDTVPRWWSRIAVSNFTLGCVFALCLLPGLAHAQYSDGVIRIGILNDQNGPFAYLGGSGSVLAAQMAVGDFGGSVNGTPVEIVSADHQNKADIGLAIARRWIEENKVDVIADVPVSSVSLAVQQLGREKKITTLMLATTSDLTGKACSPYSTHWIDDTYTMSVATAKAVVQAGGASWFFVTADYAFGHALERDATAIINGSGGKVLGSVRHPLNSPDFASFLVQAQSSGAKIVALANAGQDLLNAVKQASEFGLSARGQRLVGFLMFAADVHALGLSQTQGMLLTEGFYWDQSEEARNWSKRFFEKTKTMPTREHAGVYAAVTHYLKAAREAKTDDAAAVNAAMRKLPVAFFGRDASIRQDGRIVYPVSLYAVKSPEESRYPWDYQKEVARIEPETAFRSIKDGGCNLIQ